MPSVALGAVLLHGGVSNLFVFLYLVAFQPTNASDLAELVGSGVLVGNAGLVMLFGLFAGAVLKKRRVGAAEAGETIVAETMFRFQRGYQHAISIAAVVVLLLGLSSFTVIPVWL